MRLPTALFAAWAVVVGAPGAARAADGIDVGQTWGQCVVDPSADADLDGLDDGCEATVAEAFRPELVFGDEETAPERETFWAARPDGYRMVRVFYALSYLVDAGDPTYFGASGHDGDSEFVVLRLRALDGGRWALEEAYLSAHYLTGCDSGAWYPHQQFQFVGGQARGRPVLWIAEGKHASYPSPAECDAGGCWQDHCADAFRQDVDVQADRDLGLADAPLLDHVVATNGNEEWFWTDEIFCGWQRASGDAREGCVPDANTYAKELLTFEMSYGPVGGAGLCEACSGDDDCDDGGHCIDVGGAKVCGRECADAPCPAGASCVEIAGATQCVPDGGDCACFAACVGRACGDDGCGGSCGLCGDGLECDAEGQCIAASRGPCEACVSPAECATGLSCVAAAHGSYCLEPCDAGCGDGFECTDTADGERRCWPGELVACEGPDVWRKDACGGLVALVQACGAAAACSDGACACKGTCEGRSCGDDGCGASCGSCPQGQFCGDDGECLDGPASGCTTRQEDPKGPAPGPGAVAVMLLGAALLRRRELRAR